MKKLSNNILKGSIITAFLINAVNLLFFVAIIFRLEFLYFLFDGDNFEKKLLILALLTFVSRIIIWIELIENKTLIYLFKTINTICIILNVGFALLVLMEDLEKSWHFG
jgi:hypothetical protein